MTRPRMDLARYRELLTCAGLTDEEAQRVVRKVEQDMAELFGKDEPREKTDA